MEREFLSVAEVAAMFQCYPETVKRMARRGELPAFKFGKHWFFPKIELIQQLLDWMKNRRRLRRDGSKHDPDAT